MSIQVDDTIEIGHSYAPKRKFRVSRAYLLGAADRADCKQYHNPFRPGPDLAQYDYGFRNEDRGFHDEIDLPYSEGRK